jgi:haloalkane dehalogenase
MSAADLIASFHPRPLGADVRGAYDAPFPELAFQAGLRAFPELLPASLDDPASQPNRDAWQRLSRFERPLLTLYGAADPLTAGAERPFIRRVPGARGQPHRLLPGAGHFLHEDAGDAFVEPAVAFLSRDD